MGSICTVIEPRDIGTDPGELLGLVALPSEVERAPKQLSGSANDLIRSVTSLIDDMILRTLRERTAEDFGKVRGKEFPQYFGAMVALGSLIRVAVPDRDIEWLMAQSLSELEADFRDKGAATIGAELRDRGLFTIWILRKISDLAQQIQKTPIVRDRIEADGELARRFAVHAVWARFHVDCLAKAMSSKTPVFPEVTEEIVNGLRAVVDVYAWIRQGVDLRTEAASEIELPTIQWEPEDEAFLSDSMRDLDQKG